MLLTASQRQIKRIHHVLERLALAFLLTGPATNLTTLGVLTRLHGRRTALMFSGAVVVTALLLGRAVNGLTGVTGMVPDLGVHHEGDFGWKDGALALLGGLFLLSLVRQGPRAFVGELFEADGEGEEGHDHDHDHGEDELDDCCQDDCCAAPESSPSLIAEHATAATYEAPR